MYSRHTKTKRLKYQALSFSKYPQFTPPLELLSPFQTNNYKNLRIYPCKRLAIWP